MPSLQQIVMYIPGVVIGFAFHEFAHALVATWFGDDTPRRQGRLTLNPASHLDPLGTILLLIGGFGWAKPVQVNPANLRPRVVGDIMVSLAGVIMNFLLAILFMILTVLAYRGSLGWQHPILEETLFAVARINVILVGFNLLPIPPLDGFRVLSYLLPASASGLLINLYRYGPFVLILLIMTGFLNMSPVYSLIFAGVEGIAAPILRLFN